MITAKNTRRTVYSECSGFVALLCQHCPQKRIPRAQVYFFLNRDAIFQIDPHKHGKQPLDAV